MDDGKLDMRFQDVLLKNISKSKLQPPANDSHVLERSFYLNMENHLPIDAVFYTPMPCPTTGSYTALPFVCRTVNGDNKTNFMLSVNRELNFFLTYFFKRLIFSNFCKQERQNSIE